jgi:tetratricopeptide (TPR) repeat protein
LDRTAPPPPAAADSLLASAIEHHHAGRLARACDAYRKLLRKDPRNAAALYLMGLAKQEQGHLDRGLQLLAKAVEAEPGNVAYRHALAVAYAGAGWMTEAEAALRAAIAIAPEQPGPWTALGNALAGQDRVDEAIAAHRRALELAPDSPEVLSNLGSALKQAGRVAESLECFRAAAQRALDHPEVRFNLGTALLAGGRPAEAEAELRQAVRLDPGHARAWSNLGASRREQGKLEDAIASLEEAIRRAPGYADAHYNLGLALLARRPCADGWRQYDWREKIRDFAMRRVALPRWDGAPLDGRTLLVHCEQGLGDTIQFVRYVREAARYGGPVVVECPPDLRRLLDRAGLGARIVPRGADLPACDVQVPMMSLPGIVDPLLARAGAMVPYLAAEPDLVATWRARLGDDGRLKVGIGWQGNPAYRADGARSIPVRHFAPLANVAAARLVSLQKGEGRTQLEGLDAELAIEDLGPELDEATGSFVDTTAMMAGLDIVIASDSAVAHLAGALGVEVWLLLAHVPDWRWGMEGTSCPWYPTMRVFRQERPGDWDGLMAHVAAELVRRAGERTDSACAMGGRGLRAAP